MIKDITLNNDCSVILSNNCLKAVENRIYNYNKIVGKKYE